MEENELYHYGVLGMKWGVRRYQNYDGTYTQKGLNRYRSAEEKYKSAKTKKKSVKESYSGPDKKTKIKELSIEQKRAKKEMEKTYKSLKTDKLADEGKALYKRGKTIEDVVRRTQLTQATIAIGSGASSFILGNLGSTSLAKASIYTLVGGGIAETVLSVIGSRKIKRLRAYYAH